MSDESDPLVPSKTARKREAERLQQIGRRLAELGAEQLAALNLPKNLLDALLDYQRFPSHGAKRRQLQFIGKLMRQVDIEAIESRLADLDGESAQARYQFNQIERWRDQLLTDPSALTRFIEAYPDVDRQKLRQLVNKVTSARTEAQSKPHARHLFRVLRDAMQTNQDH